MKQNNYEIEKNIEKVLRGYSTGFLTLNIANEIKNRLKKSEYKIFSPYDEADKIILFNKKEPNVKLYRIDCYEKDKITHSSILGSLFSLNITNEMFGDIVLYDNNFYVYILGEINDYIINNFTCVGNISINLKEVSLEFLNEYKREYESYEIIVSSLRIDTIISRLIGCNRVKVQNKIKEKLILLNGDILNKTTYLLKDEDIFSIRKFGKYKYNGIINKTKKDNYIIKIDKYI